MESLRSAFQKLSVGGWREHHLYGDRGLFVLGGWGFEHAQVLGKKDLEADKLS